MDKGTNAQEETPARPSEVNGIVGGNVVGHDKEDNTEENDPT